MTVEAEPTPGRGLVQWLSRHPLLGLWGLIVGVASLVVSVVLFFESQKERAICYTVSASPTTIVRAGQSSDLRVHFKDKELTSDVSSIQILVWNNGKESVKRENILSPVSLALSPRDAILEARVKKTTRGLVGFQIDGANAPSGILALSWNILEAGDGALLEVIYTGTSVQVGIDGAVEGKLPIRQVFYGDKAKSSIFELVLSFVLCLPVGILAGWKQSRSKTMPPMTVLQARIGVAMAGAATSVVTFGLIAVIFLLYSEISQRPPFPFTF